MINVLARELTEAHPSSWGELIPIKLICCPDSSPGSQPDEILHLEGGGGGCLPNIISPLKINDRCVEGFVD